MEDFKIQVTIDESIIVQKTLFKFGIVWNSGSSDIHNTESQYLFIRNDAISHFDNKRWFEDQQLPELTFENFKKLYIKPMETKQIKIEAPEGFEIDKDKSTFELIVFKEVPKKPVRITKWEDFGTIKGWYVTNFSVVREQLDHHDDDRDRNVWPNKELAEASLALCQLIRYRDNWNEGWIADWENLGVKHCIVHNTHGINGITINDFSSQGHVLSFKDSDTAKEFLKIFRDLIAIAKPLL